MLAQRFCRCYEKTNSKQVKVDHILCENCTGSPSLCLRCFNTNNKTILHVGHTASLHTIVVAKVISKNLEVST